MTQVPDGIELTPFDDAFFQDPYGVYEKLRRLEPIHKDTASFYPRSWTVSDYPSVRSLLADERLSVDPRRIGLRRDPRADNPVTLRPANMMNLDGEAHRNLRQLVQRAFTPGAVAAFVPKLEQIAESCLAGLEGEFDLVAALSKPLPTIGIAEFIGVDPAHHQDFKRWTDSLLKQGYPMPSEGQWQEIVAADQSLRDFLTEVVSNRAMEPKQDLVSRLAAIAAQSEGFSFEEIVDMCVLLIGAGNFTTTDLISNAIYSDLTAEEVIPINERVERTLRFDPPVLAVRRFATSDIEIKGVTIETGSVVNLLIGSANHDHPDQSLLSFGRGHHHCLGAPLAQLEAEVALRTFRARFPNARLIAAERSKRMDFRGFRRIDVESQVSQ